MARTSLKIKGLDDFEKKLNALPRHIQHQASVRATAKAADFLKSELKQAIPRAAKGSYQVRLRSGQVITRHAGDLAKALIIKRIPPNERRKQGSEHKVTFWRNQATQGIGYIAHFIEYGVSPHDIQRVSKNGNAYTIRHGGHGARPFLKPTLRRSRKKMVDIMTAEINKAFNDWFKK